MAFRVRSFPEENYKAVFTEGTTLHMRHNRTKPFQELQYPELFDIAINSKCYGSCSYCYISSTKNGVNYEDICGKAERYFGGMTTEQRPFQVAIGGAGEPTLHPDFPTFLKTLRELGIMPNYTTNGMHLTSKVLEATEKYAGGVAVTCHKHLGKTWVKAISKLAPITRLNLHIIPMSMGDIKDFVDIFNLYRDKVETFVLLPYQAIGFGQPIDMQPVYRELFNNVLQGFSERELEQVAYGAYFYNELVKRPWLNVGLYEHGLFSKYLDMSGNMTLYQSSYDWETPLKKGLLGEV